MSSAAVIAAGISVAGSVYSSQQAKKAAEKAAQAGQVDIDALDAKSRDIAKRNAYESAALERELTPEVAQGRTDANNQIFSQMNPSQVDEYTRAVADGQIRNGAVGEAQTPLLRAAIAKAQADLQQGGKLDTDTQNAVMRSALAKSGTVAQGGLGLGRDMSARDLGLTSLDLQQKRLDNASRLGSQELDLERTNNDTRFNNRANVINNLQLLQQMQGNQFGRAMSAGSYAQGIGQPIVGLDPSAVANLATGNASNSSAAYANKANIAGQQSQNYMNMAGNLLGYAAYTQNKKG